MNALTDFERRAPKNDAAVYTRAQAYRILALAAEAEAEDDRDEARRHMEQAVTTLERAFDPGIDSAK